MKIVDKRTNIKKGLKFSDLKRGACFEWVDSELENEGACIKILENEVDDDYFSFNKKCIFDSGENNNQKVVLLDVTLVIEELD